MRAATPLRVRLRAPHRRPREDVLVALTEDGELTLLLRAGLTHQQGHHRVASEEPLRLHESVPAPGAQPSRRPHPAHVGQRPRGCPPRHVSKAVSEFVGEHERLKACFCRSARRKTIRWKTCGAGSRAWWPPISNAALMPQRRPPVLQPAYAGTGVADRRPQPS